MELQHPTQAELDTKPWKYVGYKDFAAYLSSDGDTFILRRFDRLHARVLLTLQDNLVELEEELDDLDNRWSARDAGDIDNGTIRNDQPERKELLTRVHRKLSEYDEMLSRYIALRARSKARHASIKCAKTWLHNKNGPIEEKEVRFLETEDLVPVASTQKPQIRYLVEQKAWLPMTRWIRLLSRRTRPTDDRPVDHHLTVQQDDEDMDVAADVFVFLAAGVMLIMPLWVLAGLEQLTAKLAVITGFVVMCLVTLNWGTLARPSETLAVTAGYSAVLVVFLQIGDAAIADTPA
ncbi:hypothetical protein MFIFM68171_00937 [Madurella fahalii]|uniref:DUF6594 domain-containing protein n=1 Tax=Madurella fahalii TaxID=1157608 RepID=A0ABQ0FYZ3_9PEZI